MLGFVIAKIEKAKLELWYIKSKLVCIVSDIKALLCMTEGYCLLVSFTAGICLQTTVSLLLFLIVTRMWCISLEGQVI